MKNSCKNFSGRGLALLLSVFLALLPLTACGGESEETGETASGTASAGSGAALSSKRSGSEEFSAEDFETEYDRNAAVSVTLSDAGSRAADASVLVSGTTVTLTKGGVYRVTGALSDGQVKVDAKGETVRLVLAGASVCRTGSAALYLCRAKKVIVTLEAGSENLLQSRGTFVCEDENKVDAALFSKSDLTLNGAGALTVSTEAGHGIVSKDSLVVTGGTLAVTASSHALAGKDSVRIGGGTMTLNAGGDGIHAENTDDTALGYLFVSDGTLNITAAGDGLDAATTLQVEGGKFTVTAHTDTKSDNSTKGLKASGDLLITGGEIAVTADDDALHTNRNAAVTGGTMTLATGDDGIHADGNLTVSGGEITVTESYEGLEGLTVDITGGTVQITASDDGINAGGGTDQSGFGGFGGNRMPDTFGFGGGMRPGAVGTEGTEPPDAAGGTAEPSSCYLNISGGEITVNADGDGVDSNGTLTVSGGTLVIYGPTNNGNGAIDYETSGTVTGGRILALGASGMAENFGSASTQGSALVTLSTAGSAGDAVCVRDSAGKELLSCTARKNFNSVVFSCPELQVGETYTLAVGTQTQTITLDSLLYGSGGMGGGFGGPGGDPGNPGGMRDRGNPGRRP